MNKNTFEKNEKKLKINADLSNEDQSKFLIKNQKITDFIKKILQSSRNRRIGYF